MTVGPEQGLALPERFVRILGPATGRGVKVGIIDSGFDPGLAQQFGNVGLSYDLTEPFPTMPRTHSLGPDLLAHGTACYSTASRIAPGSEYCSIRVFREALKCDIGLLCEAISIATDLGCQVINLSLRVDNDGSLKLLYQECARALRKGTIVVAAAFSANTPSYPAWFDNVLAVEPGAQDSPFSFAYRQSGPVELQCASGIRGNVIVGSGESRSAGTASFAAPVGTALVALIREARPGCTLDDIRKRLASLAEGTNQPPLQSPESQPTVTSKDVTP